MGEDPLPFLDLTKKIVGEDLQLEPELAHSLRHQLGDELDLIAGLETAIWARSASVGIPASMMWVETESG